MARSAPIEDVTDDRVLRLLRSRAAARAAAAGHEPDGRHGWLPRGAQPRAEVIPDLADVLASGPPVQQTGWVPAAPRGMPSRREAVRPGRTGRDAPGAHDLQPGHVAQAGQESRPGRDPSQLNQPSSRRQPSAKGSQLPPGRHRAPSPRIFTIPAPLAAAQFRVRGSAVLALVAVTLVAALGFGLRVAVAARAGEPVPVAPSRGGLVGRTATASALGPTALASLGSAGVGGTAYPGGTPGAATAGPSVGMIVIHVVGEVAAPGVVRVPVGSRVIDVITAAGGSVGSADLKRINLARVVQDGEQVHVPAPGEPILAGAWGSTLRPESGATSGGSAVGGAATRVNLNTADLTVLDGLPGVGPVLAQRILDWRAEHGRFTSVDELGEVSGIGEKLLAVLAPKVTL